MTAVLEFTIIVGQKFADRFGDLSVFEAADSAKWFGCLNVELVNL